MDQSKIHWNDVKTYFKDNPTGLIKQITRESWIFHFYIEEIFMLGISLDVNINDEGIDFDEKGNNLMLHAYNEETGEEFNMKIPMQRIIEFKISDFPDSITVPVIVLGLS